MEDTTLNICSHLIKAAGKIVVLTGAGISTESGIKDFRSSSGIYQLAPEYVLSIAYFFKHPREFYQFALDNLYHPDALPNVGHKILAKWEKERKVNHIITQNIDGLHQKAGSEQVIEFHGTIKTARCLHCGKVYTTEEMTSRMNQMEDFYICNNCESSHERSRYIKPDVVLYGDAGDWFTAEGFSRITNMIYEADCLLVLGTSLKVTPFSIFPKNRRKGVPMILINKGDTPYDHAQDVYVIHQSIGETLTRLDESLSN